MRETKTREVSRVFPDAPYVTETKSGWTCSMARTVSHVRGAASGLRGGNSSNDTVGRSTDAGAACAPRGRDIIHSIDTGGSTHTLL